MKNKENQGHSNGVHRSQHQLPLDNPETPPERDWWDELCKAHGAKNHWPKKKKGK